MKYTIIFLVIAAMAAGGCASSISGKVYSRDTARKVQTVKTGVVLFVREVLVEGTKSGIGAVAGGVVGYVLGSTIGSGSGKDIARAAGTLGGAAAGAGVEEGITRQKAFEITVQLDSGETIAIVQGADETFTPGDTVRVISQPGKEARVAH